MNSVGKRPGKGQWDFRTNPGKTGNAAVWAETNGVRNSEESAYPDMPDSSKIARSEACLGDQHDGFDAAVRALDLDARQEGEETVARCPVCGKRALHYRRGDTAALIFHCFV